MTTSDTSVLRVYLSFEHLSQLIKTYLRNKLSQENLSGLSVISIEKNISESLDYDDIINQFTVKKIKKSNVIKICINFIKFTNVINNFYYLLILFFLSY